MPARACLWALLLAGSALADDWPMWRHDAGRSAYSSEDLPATLHLHWVREYGPRVQAWDDPLNHDLMSYDRIFEPVVLGDRMFIGFNDTDKVVALDIRSGKELWRFYTDGPVRLPPAAWNDRVYFTSDDGYVYCVSADRGTLHWKFLGGPSARKVLGNRRVISAWPARGGPVVRDGVVYFAASIWPFMGTFIYALDAATGTVVWVNDSTGAQYIKQPHSAPAFAGVAPQGALVATRDTLLVPGGRSVPAAFDLKTGAFLHFRIDDGGKGTGGSLVMANDTTFFVHTRHRGVQDFDLKTGKKGKLTLNEPVLGRRHLYAGQDHSALQMKVIEAQRKIDAARYTELKSRSELREALYLEDAASLKKITNALASAAKKVRDAQRELEKAREKLGTQWAGQVVQCLGADKHVQWEVAADGTGDLIKAGSRLYAAGKDRIVAIDPPTAARPARVAWSHPVEGRVLRLLAARGRLFAVTLEGCILAFGAALGPAVTVSQTPQPLAPPPPGLAGQVRALVAEADAAEGYALAFGAGDGALLAALLEASRLHVVAVDPDPANVERLRRRMDEAGVYGTRVSVHAGDPLAFKAPAYLAQLVWVGGGAAVGLAQPPWVRAAYRSVRPYGGSLWIACDPASQSACLEGLRAAQLSRARVTAGAFGVRVVREGPLPGSADWTHQYGDMANTVKSDDATVRLPLGVLWFGGNSNLDILPRHGHGPSEQVIGGRLFIQGMNCLSARDVYTGRVLWKVEIPDLGTEGMYYDDTYMDAPLSTVYNQRHIPGANARGANYVATLESVYVAVSNVCRVFSARTGERQRDIEMPRAAGQEAAPLWGFIGMDKDILFGGAGFANYQQRFRGAAPAGLPSLYDLSASRGLVAFDRRTGAVLWRADARHSFLHNGIVAGNGRVYCLDRLPKSAESKLKRRGANPPGDYRIVAFDARTGRRLWEQAAPVFGSWLGFSAEHDLLLQAGASATDRLKDEVGRGMTVLRGRDGLVVWTNDLKYSGPCILHHQLVITTPTSYKTSSGAFHLTNGTPHLLSNPLTGEAEPWRVYRTYGCNTPIASEYLLTFRSGAAGFYDLETHGGTGNFGGFKSGCSANLIAANGVLNAPDYTRTCSCAYQNQTSLALVHMPELELWTYNLYGAELTNRHRIKQVGLNFGAPGDRRADTGTLWLDHPSVGGVSARLDVALAGNGTNFFCRHASRMSGDGPPWVLASGVRNIESLSIATCLCPPPPSAKKKRTTKSDDEDEEDDDKDEDAGTDAASKAASKTSFRNNRGGGPTASASAPAAGSQAAFPPAVYTVRLYFAEPDGVLRGQRVFAVELQGNPVLSGLDIVAEAGGTHRGLVKTFENVVVTNAVSLRFVRAAGSLHGPVLCGVELLDESVQPASLGAE
ncbi:MAG: PQQ-binding-like beta-propeller repeat protein [Verrucomicrobia bacterium]|nr:PQQ-binding-like beta-propeller repeat protein [Verrucomicrobiota bacterium]